MRTKLLAVLALASWLPASACNERVLAVGDVNSIIVTADPALWAGVEDMVVPSLEGTVFTVRDEKTFKVTHQDPNDEDWFRLRLFKQLLLVGTVADPWMTEALAQLEEPASPPQILQVHDLWARNQLVTIALLPDGGGVEEVAGLLPALADLYDRQYREWTLSKMFVSGRDTALARQLRTEARFNLVVPEVYRHTLRDSVHTFRNDNPDPSRLIREVTVSWRSPIPAGLQAEDILSWRAGLVEQYYNFPQVVELERAIAGPSQFKGNHGYGIQAVWANPPDAFPAAGPFITRAIVCLDQDRMYLIDAWLYAPGAEKYEYMIQLEEIVDSFDCNGL